MAGIVGGLMIGSLAFGGPLAKPAEAAWCKPAPALSNSWYTPKITYSNGATFGYYTIPIGAGNLSSYQTRVSVFKGSQANSKMTATFAPLGTLGNQRTFASSVPNLQTYVNTDYFVDGNRMPYSAIIHGGKMVYAPAPGNPEDPTAKGYSGVLAWSEKTYSETAGFALSAPLWSGANKVSVSGVNIHAIPANSIVAFTPKAASKVLPRGAFAIQVTNGRIAATFLKGTTARPRVGFLFQATGTAVKSLKKFLNGKPAKYLMPALVERSLVVDSVSPTGYVVVGTSRIKIRAINYQGSNNYGATLYDSNFAGSQVAGTAMFQTDESGTVNYVTRGSSHSGSLYGTSNHLTFQVASDQAALVNQISVGQKLTVVQSFRASSKNGISEATGRGAFIVKDGVNVKECAGQSEDIRPRTAIGWDANGNFWVVTTSMGNLPYSGYDDHLFRQGGSTIHQIADWLRLLGATSAVTFDGGGSTTQYITLNGALSRQDVPESQWLRDTPVGVAFSAAN